MRKKKIYLRIGWMLLILIGQPITAQTPNQDRLLKEVKIMPDDTNKVNTLQLIASNYLNHSRDYKKMGEFAWKGLALSQKLHYEKGLANAYSCIGIWYSNKGNKEMALYYYTNALHMMQRLNNKKGVGNVYNNIARVMLANGDYVNALNNNLKSLKIKEELQDKEGMALSYLNIGNVFSVQDKLDEALGYYIKSMQLSEGMINTNASNAYNNIGNIFAEKKRYTDALTYHLMALNINEKLNDKLGIAASCNSIGSDYFNLKQTDKSLPYHIKAYELATRIENKPGQAFACNGIGNINQFKKNYSEAVIYYTKMLRLGTELNNKRIIQLAYANFISLYKETGSFKQALAYTELANNMKDSLSSLERQKQLSELITKYQLEKREKEILILNNEKELNKQQMKQQELVRWMLIIGLVILILIIIGIYRRYRFKQKTNLQLIKTQNELYTVIEQKEKLTSILAHDLKTPLRFMVTISTYLNKMIQPLNSEKLDALSNELTISAKNTYAFADELLTWLTIQHQGFTITVSEVDLNALMNELFGFFKDIAKIQDTELTIDLSSPISVKTDKRLLKIILRNILDNAIKNTSQGKVTVFVSKTDKGIVEIQIGDTGNGMTKEQLERLDVSNTYGFQFEIKNKLGFQIIKDLSNLLHIKLKIDSEVNVGTTLTLQLHPEQEKTDYRKL